MNSDSILYRRQFILGDYPIPDLPEWKSIPFGPFHLQVHPDLETTLAKGSKGEFQGVQPVAGQLGVIAGEANQQKELTWNFL